ncbi:HD domain-containing protein [Pseudoalteromonas sp. C2R02]|uniref:HD domain-containing phosphohydrolase n=1 Tax=Pseudoalteromonas sp. C2R02 TaxID=2841565 RepID=UPI001C09D632|nr:HD domain-containing phosphohydrolase [Pseudoalteromonas sp. C2R02]MBU2971148.1 HD domain-containing protein [Pseudoalteromonas sp. C2R02]
MADYAFESASKQFDLSIESEVKNLRTQFTPAGYRLKYITSRKEWQDFETYQADSRLIKELANYLTIDALADAVYIGFKSGNFISVDQIKSQAERVNLKAPQDAMYLVKLMQHQSEDDNQFKMIFLDRLLNQIGEPLSISTAYKIFSRPWYQRGLISPSASIVAPYQAFDRNNKIMTLVQSSIDNDVVAGIDINMIGLSNQLKASYLDNNTVQALLSKNNSLLAYQKFGVLFPQSDENKSQFFTEKSKKALDIFVDKNLDQYGLSSIFFENEKWLGKVVSINHLKGVSVKLFVAMPEDDILAASNFALIENLQISLLIVLAFVPLSWLFSRGLIRPIHRVALQTQNIAGLKLGQANNERSHITELAALEDSVFDMRHSLHHFFGLLEVLAKEKNLMVLLEKVSAKSCVMLKADASFIFLNDASQKNILNPLVAWSNGSTLNIDDFTEIDIERHQQTKIDKFMLGEVQFVQLDAELKAALEVAKVYPENSEINALLLPLIDRNNQIIGLLGFSFCHKMEESELEKSKGIARALSEFVSLAIEGDKLFENQKQLMKSFIQLIAGAIDTKSPYTGAHCQRVPELTMMLAQEAANSNKARLKNFSLSSEQWDELKIAAWLHDCGKVTTPEDVVDKASKLEAIYNRIHEVRMRFEVLRRNKPSSELPSQEFVLSDKAEHRIPHIANKLELDSHLRFNMKRPEYRYNLGELHNLVIAIGTINEEVSYIINHHIVETINMLEQLPFPDNLKRVPEIAGSHHEQINGTGYPQGLKGDEISIESRILSIADIFEALTASDRPYKPAKSLSQSIAILDYMRQQKHIDSDLFELFLSSDVYLTYAQKFLKPEQIDDENIALYLK